MDLPQNSVPNALALPTDKVLAGISVKTPNTVYFHTFFTVPTSNRVLQRGKFIVSHFSAKCDTGSRHKRYVTAADIWTPGHRTLVWSLSHEDVGWSNCTCELCSVEQRVFIATVLQSMRNGVNGPGSFV